MSEMTPVPNVNIDELREAIKDEYRVVARSPDQGFHFHTGRPLTRIVEYRDEWLDGVPENVISCFAGTGNPFLGRLLENIQTATSRANVSSE